MHERDNVFAYGGLAAREPDLGHALGDEEGGEVGDFGGGEEVGGGREGHAVGRHTIGAAKVAALGDGDAEVVVLAGEGVREEGGEGFGVFEGGFAR